MSQNEKVYFVSLGCAKNLVDSQVMLGSLRNENYEITAQPETADVIIVNTCSFIQASKEESIDTILEMADYKETGKCKVLVASGCLSQRYHEKLEKQLPEVDLFVGTGEYQKITDILKENRKTKELGDAIPKRSYVNQPAFIHTEKDERILTGHKFSSYLKLSEGCNRRCAFCIIPKLRGNVRSRTIASLVEEAKLLVSQGVVELNLVAQDLTEYGMEWKYKERLETLLPELCKIEGLEWIRLHYVYPDQFSDELIEIIAREPKIVKYLDMPIQHTNDRLLEKMNRRLRKEKLFSLIEKLRSKIPALVLRTSIIVGFPSETDEEFQELCQDLEKLKLDHVGVFEFSKEEGTKAFEMGDQVHPATKRKRRRELVKILQNQKESSLEKAVGTKEVALLEGVSEESELLLKARLSTQAEEIDGGILLNDLSTETVNISDLKAGALVEVEITGRIQEDLVGKVIRVVKNAPEFSPKTSAESMRVELPSEKSISMTI